jgi:anti-anti-sigma factor
MAETEIKSFNSIVVLKPQKSLFGGPETEDLARHIEELESNGNRFLVINLEKATYMTSSGIRVVIQGHKKYRAGGRRLVLCCVSEVTKKVLINESEEKALASFAVPPPAVPSP